MCCKYPVQKDFSWFNETTEFHTLPSIRFRVFSLFSLMMRPLAHSELSFVKGDRYGSIFILSHKISSLTDTIVWRLCHFPGGCMCGFFLSKIMSWSSILFHWSICLFYSNTMLFSYFTIALNSSKIETEIWAGDTYSSFLIGRIFEFF